jgi:hypothetical protein
MGRHACPGKCRRWGGGLTRKSAEGGEGEQVPRKGSAGSEYPACMRWSGCGCAMRRIAVLWVRDAGDRHVVGAVGFVPPRPVRDQIILFLILIEYIEGQKVFGHVSHIERRTPWRSLAARAAPRQCIPLRGWSGASWTRAATMCCACPPCNRCRGRARHVDGASCIG